MALLMQSNKFFLRDLKEQYETSPYLDEVEDINILFRSPKQSVNMSAAKLNTGANIPIIGFGTWQDSDSQTQAVTEALEAGYTHIDTARVYGTESAVGNAIRRSGLPRTKLFITTKLWNNSHSPQDVVAALDASLQDLQMDYVDLYLMHWPSAFKSGPDLIPVGEGKLLVEEIDYVETYKAMEELLLTGKTKAIGISNFSQHELVRLLENTAVVPAVHQLELHPWLQQKDFVEYNRSKGIHVTHYSPLGNQNGAYNNSSSDYGKLIDDPVLMDIGKKHGKSSAQVALAWGITLGHSVIPKSKTLSRIKENLESDFSLDEEDLGRIERLDKKLRFNDPSDTFDYNYFADLDGKR